MRCPHTLGWLTTLVVAGLCQAAVPGKTYHFTVLHTNDMHGRFWHDSDGEYGLSAQKTLIDGIRAEVRKAGGYTLVLNGGDVNTGVPESDLQDAEPMFVGMDAIGYDAMALGNHEFDKPRTVLVKQQGWAHFPMLSANLSVAGKPVAPASARFNLGGLKVAVLGLTTPDTPHLVNPEVLGGAQFADPLTVAARQVPMLRRHNDVVIALTHMGYYPDGKHGDAAPGDVELARAVPGIALVVGGHTHTVLCMAGPNVLESAHQPGAACQPDHQNGSWIVQAGEMGKYVGRADFAYRNGKVTLVRYQLIPVNLKHAVTDAAGKKSLVSYGPAIAEDAATLKRLTPYETRGQQQLGETVGQLDGTLDGLRDHVRRQPTNLGTFIGRVLMARTGADVAMINSGDIRDSLPAGKVTYRDILKVLPFGSTLVTVDLSGADLKVLLEKGAHMQAGSGGYAQFAGLGVTRDGDRITAMTINGRPIDNARRYRLVTNNYVAAGGDGYPVLNRLPGFVDTGFVDADVLRGFFGSHALVKSADYQPTL